MNGGTNMKAYAEPAPALDAGVELGEPDGLRLKSVIVPQDFLPDRSSDWARLHFAGCKTGYELVVGRMGAEDTLYSLAGQIERVGSACE